MTPSRAGLEIYTFLKLEFAHFRTLYNWNKTWGKNVFSVSTMQTDLHNAKPRKIGSVEETRAARVSMILMMTPEQRGGVCEAVAPWC